MRKLLRLGVIFLVIGLSLLLTTALRGSPIYIQPIKLIITPHEWVMLNPQLWMPRSIKLSLFSISEIDVYILDEYGINAWCEEKRLTSIFTLNGVKQSTLELQLNERGKYAILIHNPSDLHLDVYISITLYMLEKDLLSASIALTTMGIIAIITSKILPRYATRGM
ncbi:MAG: hypothetical protein QXU09_04385 [Thermoproteota archaeon]